MQRGGGGGGARGAAKLNTCVHTHIAPDYLSNTPPCARCGGRRRKIGMGVKVGLRVSVSAHDTTDAPATAADGGSSRLYGFVVGRDAGGARQRPRWVVRFDGGASELRLPACKLRIEAQPAGSDTEAAELPSMPPADEVHETRYLPAAAQRAQHVFGFDAVRHDFRAWFVEDVVRPAARKARSDAAAAAAGDALRLPPTARAPAPGGGAGGGGGGGCVGDGEEEEEDPGRLLSHLHLTPAAGERAAQLSAAEAGAAGAGAGACRSPVGGGGGGGGGGSGGARAARVRIPPTAAASHRQLEAERANKQQQQQQDRNDRKDRTTRPKLRPNRTLFHSAFCNTLRASPATCAGCCSRAEQAELVARRARFEALLRRFVREVVAPLIGCAERPDDCRYQASPTLRISYPSGKAMGHPHCDFEYKHQPCELNFWLPLTEVWGGNTLYAESAPGRGDFAPFELGWGRCVRFWGNQVRHFAVANDSGFTRVSLDLRVLDVRRYNPVFVDLHAGSAKLSRNKFRLGQYYASARVPTSGDDPPPQQEEELVAAEGGQEDLLVGAGAVAAGELELELELERRSFNGVAGMFAAAADDY